MSSGGIHSTAPSASVLFFPFEKEDTKSAGTSASEFLKTKPIEVSADLLAVTTSKGKGAVGTFSVTLSSNEAYKGILHPGTWCLIYLNDRPLTGVGTSELDSGLKMIGIVKSVRRFESIDHESGRKVVRYQVSGEDFQSVFNMPIYMNLNIVGGNNSPVILSVIQELAKTFNSKGSVRADEIIRIYIQALIGPMLKNVSASTRALSESRAIVGGARNPILVPPEVSKAVLGRAVPGNLFSAFVTFFLQQGLYGQSIPMPQMGGVVPVWSMLQAFSNRLLNEIYCDLLPIHSATGGQKPTLSPSFVLRAIPFSSDSAPHKSCIPFSSAVDPGHVEPVVKSDKTKKSAKSPVKRGTGAHFYISKSIHEDEIVSLSSAKSDAERFNFFFAVPNLITGNAPVEAGLAAKILTDGEGAFGDVVSVQRYGLRPFVASTDYFLEATNNSAGMADMLRLNRIVRDLWKDAYKYENGSVTLVGTHEHIPVGTNIKFAERGWVAHVERVDHEFQVESDSGRKRYFTSVVFSRLQKTNGDPVDLTEDLSRAMDGGSATGRQGDWDRGITRKK